MRVKSLTGKSSARTCTHSDICSIGKVTPQVVAPRAPYMEAMLIAMERLGISALIRIPTPIVAVKSKIPAQMSSRIFPSDGISSMVKHNMVEAIAYNENRMMYGIILQMRAAGSATEILSSPIMYTVKTISNICKKIKMKG